MAHKNTKTLCNTVALFTRAGIEIKAVAKPFEDYTEVALFTRAWIEIGIVSPL